MCVTLDQSHHLAKPQFPSLSDGGDSLTSGLPHAVVETSYNQKPCKDRDPIFGHHCIPSLCPQNLGSAARHMVGAQ